MLSLFQKNAIDAFQHNKIFEILGIFKELFVNFFYMKMITGMHDYLLIDLCEDDHWSRANGG